MMAENKSEQTIVHANSDEESQDGQEDTTKNVSVIDTAEESDTEDCEDEVSDIVDTKEVIEQAISVASIQPPTVDDAESDMTIPRFMTDGCGCKHNDGQPCSNLFTAEQLQGSRLEANELSRDELDLVILGKLAAFLRVDKARPQQHRAHFLHGGQKVCKKTFLFLHGIGEMRLKNLMKHFKQNGITGRTHGNTRHRPHHALSLPTVKSVVTFIVNYSEQHSLALPGRIPGYSRTDIQLLPSSTSKKSIWELFQSSRSDSPSNQSVAYSTFCRL